MSLQELLTEYAQKYDISIRTDSKLFEDKNGKLYIQLEELWLSVEAVAGKLTIIQVDKQDKRKLKHVKNIDSRTWNGASFGYAYGD